MLWDAFGAHVVGLVRGPCCSTYSGPMRLFFGAKKRDWDQLVLVTLAPKLGTRLSQNQLKSDTTNNITNKAASSVK